MGAEPAQVMRMLVRRTLMLGVFGVAIGAAGVLAATRGMAKFLFGVSPTDPLTFVAAAALLTGVVLLVGVVPAWRASIVDPVVALRHEEVRAPNGRHSRENGNAAYGEMDPCLCGEDSAPGSSRLHDDSHIPFDAPPSSP